MARTAADKSRQLSPAQEAALELLAVGKHDGEVAEAVGVRRQAVNGWKNWHPEFKARLNARRREVYGQAADRLRALLDTALGVLEAELTTTGPEGAEARFRAAVKVLELGAGGLAPLVADPGPEDAWGVAEQAAARRGADIDRMIISHDVEQVQREWAERLAAVEPGRPTPTTPN